MTHIHGQQDADLHDEHGQTGDECSEGENRCELCLADEDAEADAIEGSMNT